MNLPRAVVTLVTVMLMTGCVSSGGSGDEWSRTYFAPRERVIDAAIEVLEEEGYLVEVDREKGRIVAEPSRSSVGDLVSLEVRVTRKDDRIRVDVQTRSGASLSNASSRPQESPVLEFLYELDLRMQGG